MNDSNDLVINTELSSSYYFCMSTVTEIFSCNWETCFFRNLILMSNVEVFAGFSIGKINHNGFSFRSLPLLLIFPFLKKRVRE
jgi:hypothetical protein